MRNGDFMIHEDPRTEETEMMDPVHATEEVDPIATEEADPIATEEAEMDDDGNGEEEGEPEAEAEVEDEDEDEESSDDDDVDKTVLSDMEKLQRDFPGFKDKYRLIKRIGEGTFSTVYKAEDVMYDHYDNRWDHLQANTKWTPPPLKRQSSYTGPQHPQPRSSRNRSRYVAVKKIYVTSSPTRIFNELELLHDLRDCPSVCPLITAFRHTDQVIAVLPYFRHGDFRAYFRDMTIPDIRIYLRSLFTALKSVHAAGILHRDIKPTNFLYDPATQHGVLVDFGLAEKQGSDSKPCLCHESAQTRKYKQTHSVWAQTAGTPQSGYPKSDTRPSRRANRAGTRGFRAPEVLFKCTEQTPAIDIWSVGVIILTILSKRFPFFNSADDVEAMIEIATIFGTKRMRNAGLLHGCVFESTIPTIGNQGFPMEKIILWSTCRGSEKPLTAEEKLAVQFLEGCMDLNPVKRLTAADALQHDFLRPACLTESESGDYDEMDILAA